MAQIDASIPLSGQQYQAPDLIGGATKAYQLKEAMGQSRDADQARAERQQVKGIFSQGGSPEDTAQKLMGVSPETGLAYQKNRAEMMEKQAQLQHLGDEHKKADFDLKAKQIDLVYESMLSVDQHYKQLAPKLGAQQAAAVANVEYHKQIAGLVQSGAIAPEQAAQFQDFNPDQFYQLMPKVLGAKGMVEMERSDREFKLKQAEFADKKRHEGVTEKALGGGFTDEMGGLMAAFAEQGISVPAGFRSKAQQAMLYKGLLERNPDKTPEEIASLVKSGQISLKFDQAATVTAGHRSGAMAVVEEAIPDLIKQAKEASHKVPRGKFVPLNRLALMTESQLSDPNLVDLRLANQALQSEYQQVIARGGSNVTALKEAMDLLQIAPSQEAYDRAADRVQKEVDINVRATEKARDRISGKTPSASSKPDASNNDPLGLHP